MKLILKILYFTIVVQISFHVYWYMKFVTSYVPKEEMCMTETLKIMPCDTPPELRY